MEFLFLAFPLMTSSFADVKGKQHLSVEINCDFRQLNCGSVMQMCLCGSQLVPLALRAMQA